jgi:hypothetical protein
LVSFMGVSGRLWRRSEEEKEMRMRNSGKA